MNIDITVEVKITIEVDDNLTLFYNKTPDKWTEQEITQYKNEIVWEFDSYDLGKLNLERKNIKYKAISFE